jgi:dipeptidyl aminopeptidase/acylaminoacyl peptidase
MICQLNQLTSIIRAKEVAGLKRATIVLLLVALWLTGVAPALTNEKSRRRPFTVADEIGLTRFGGSWTAIEEQVAFSPDGRYFAVKTERGRADKNRVEDSLRFYRSQQIIGFLEHSLSSAPSPMWVVTRAGKEGPIMNSWKWLADSGGVAFLEAESFMGKQRLVLADLRRKAIEILTPRTDGIGAFDLRDRQHYVYTVRDPEEEHHEGASSDVTATVGTERSLFELILPNDPVTKYVHRSAFTVWAVIGGKRFMVNHNHTPLKLFGEKLALSPDGKSLVTTMPVPDVPREWESLYVPPFQSDTYRIHSGQYEPKASRVHEYVLVGLNTGLIQPLTGSPVSNDAGWWTLGMPTWSSDSRDVLLPGTFVTSKEDLPSRPCVALVEVASRTTTCIEVLKGHTPTGVEPGYHLVTNARFANGDSRRVLVDFRVHDDWTSVGTIEYQPKAGGSWEKKRETRRRDGQASYGSLQISVRQGMNDPPVLIAETDGKSRVIWDPDRPLLHDVELGRATVFTWKDRDGRERRGGLYKPIDYQPGTRYPLVIQTHGFEESQFLPSGLFTTAFAARELAAADMMVLQVGEVGDCEISTPNEGLCNASGYEIAANQLVSDGLVDSDKIGIIGFSRTCFYVMEMLTTSGLHLRAASITDGVMETYSQYLDQINEGNEVDEENAIIGAAPFGDGLQQWLQHSPGFNLDKITTPLLVVGCGPDSLLLMWEPYAGLRYLHRPVDLIMLNTDEHILTNPAARMASQGGSVDWFRFWLKGEEDTSSAKVGQYRRWHKLRHLQETNDARFAVHDATSR